MSEISSRKKHFWIITELFYPSETSTAYILTRIARCLSSEYDVHVICGRTGDLPVETPDFEVDIHYCGTSTTSRRNLIGRTVGMVLLTGKLLFSAFRHLRRDEQVLIVTNPAPLMVGACLLKQIKHTRMTLLVHDVFPENTLPAGIFRSKKSVFYRLLQSIFNRAYRAADQSIVLGRDMEKAIRLKFPANNCKPIHIIENWADTDSIHPVETDYSLVPDVDISGKIVLQYAGNLGRVQGLDTLVECLHESRNPLLHLCIWGSGAILPELERFVGDRSVSNISFHGSYRRDQQCDVLNSCDLAVISLSDKMYGMGVPSKTYNIMAAGRPILFVGDPNSEVGLMVCEHKIGYVVPNDPMALTDFFRLLSSEMLPELHQMGLRARKLAEAFYSEEIILNKYLRILS